MWKWNITQESTYMEHYYVKKLRVFDENWNKCEKNDKYALKTMFLNINVTKNDRNNTNYQIGYHWCLKHQY